MNQVVAWAGPFKTERLAIDAMRLLAGSGFDALFWPTDKGLMISDGLDLETGKPRTALPVGAYWRPV